MADINEVFSALWRDIEVLRRKVERLETQEREIHAARVYNSANISIPDTTWTALTFDSERYDTDGFHSVLANTARLTAPTAGYYRITGNVSFVNNAVGERRVGIRLGGATQLGEVSQVTQPVHDADLIVTTVYQLDAGNYVELMVYQTSGGALNVLMAANISPEFMIERV